jgi:hypothetical protein
MQGPTLSSELVAYFDISRPTLSRRVQELGESVVTIGKGRATQLAARHEDAGDSVRLYQVQGNGQVDAFGQLTALQQSKTILWLLESEDPQTALCADEFKNGLFPGWPWFLEDLRPAGFLGRAFSQRMSKLFSVDKDPNKWSDFDLLTTIVGFGSNLQGNLILGNGRALTEFQENKLQASGDYYRNSSPSTYPLQAQRALNEGEEYGSSAGGEQPKFTTMVCETTEATPRAVIVKFSPRLDTAVGQRWADLLHAEHIANQVLGEAGFATAQTRIFHFENRIFLESERFDRVGLSGRKGLVTLRALDAAYIGQAGDSWAEVARKLHAGKWITEEDRDRMVRLHCFGQLIANNDMHWGNLSFFLPEVSPFPLAPVYDMLPMYFRPSGTGEILERSFEPNLPKPEDQAAWLEMHPHALMYWHRVQECPEISTEFQKIAEQAITALQHIHQIATT